MGSQCLSKCSWTEMFSFDAGDLTGMIPDEVCQLWNHSLSSFGFSIRDVDACSGLSDMCPTPQCCPECIL